MQTVVSTEADPAVEIIVTDALDGPSVRRNLSVIESTVAMEPTHLILDLTRCGTVDEVGAAFLADLHRTVGDSGGRLTLRGLSMPLCLQLQSAQLEEVLLATDRPPGYLPRHRVPRRRSRRAARERQVQELRWWQAPAADRSL
ncbi:STAS domain-containing protein [Dactylosporangium sp. NPDC049742]|uniref:STAS domain-containing protein n=1 Tax=Dactylosporangium sp. NPDC049742 TaxID=3154737 RepID=UPI0034371B9A